jgi:hypothetical protein
MIDNIFTIENEHLSYISHFVYLYLLHFVSLHSSDFVVSYFVYIIYF